MPPVSGQLLQLPLRDLYSTTLERTQKYRPWACDEDGHFVGLRYRKDFAHLVLASDGLLSEDEMIQTSYWQLLNVPLSTTPRDGGLNWVYANPRDQMRRYVQLIRSLKNNGYVTSERQNVAEDFNESAPGMSALYSNGREKTFRYKGREYPGLLRVSSLDNEYHCLNGTHRLATLTALSESGAFTEQNILVYYLPPTSLPMKAMHRIQRLFGR